MKLRIFTTVSTVAVLLDIQQYVVDAGLFGTSFFDGQHSALNPDGTLRFKACPLVAPFLINPNFIRLKPYPIVAGSGLKVTVNGQLNEPIMQGATVEVTAQIGWYKHTMTLDVCEEAKKSGLICPIKPGEHDLSLDVNVPYSPIGGIHATLLVNGKNFDEKPLFCFTSKVLINKS
ncbi:hypothetical protein BDF19DRAFT_411464 [Syncephalis fuscata]|nr:hypothetical protein BDF19DRAFT_411464 [Syncephalis fuscata]